MTRMVVDVTFVIFVIVVVVVVVILSAGVPVVHHTSLRLPDI